MLCGQVRTAAAKYALALHVREHDNPPQPVIDEALREGWAPAAEGGRAATAAAITAPAVGIIDGRSEGRIPRAPGPSITRA